jgi:TetR/AcrR family transcriptional regulator, cholesterol catabolism regulator
MARLRDVTLARAKTADRPDRRAQIIDGVLRLLANSGIAGVSMRAVAREAEVALGLVHYYFDDKTALIAASLRLVGKQDLEIVQPDPALPPERRLLVALRSVADPEFLTTEYLSLRMQLWALAQVNDEFAEINSAAQSRYRSELADLITAARPDLSRRECARRAADIDVLQNGLWLTRLLGLDRAAIRRGIDRTVEIATT